MMKRLSLIHNFFSEIRVSSIVLFIIVLISCLSITLTTGMFRYTTNAYNAIKDANLENALYVMSDIDFSKETNIVTQEINSLIDDLQQYECVESVMSVKTVNTFMSGKYYVSIVLYDDEMLDAFSIRTKVGFNEKDLREPADDAIPVIVGTKIFSYPDSGANDSLIMLSKGKKTEIKIKPVGTLRYPYMHIAFSNATSTVEAKNLFSTTQCLIAYESPEVLDYFLKNADVTISSNFMLKLKSGTTEEDMESLKKYINSIGAYASYEEIISNTLDYTKVMLKESLPLPAYFSILSMISLFSIAILTVNKKMKDAAIYHICGLSKRKIFFHFLESMSLIYLAAVVINIIFIIIFPLLNENKIVDLEAFIIDEFTVMYLVLYALVLLIITTAVPVVMTRSETAMTMLRRVEK